MPSDPRPTETVVLLTERRSGATGRVHEIGTRARVIGRSHDVLELEIAGETLACPATLVASTRQRTRTTRPWRLRGAASVQH